MKLVIMYKINSIYVKQGSMKMLWAACIILRKKENAPVECSKRQTVFVPIKHKPMFMSAIKERACCTSVRAELWKKGVYDQN